jgi:hypothetical protein
MHFVVCDVLKIADNVQQALNAILQISLIILCRVTNSHEGLDGNGSCHGPHGTWHALHVLAPHTCATSQGKVAAARCV